MTSAERMARTRARRAELASEIAAAAADVDRLAADIEEKAGRMAPVLATESRALSLAASRVVALSREITGADRRKRKE